MDGVQLIDQALLERLLEAAAQHPRRRLNHNFHGSADDNPHRFLNAMLRGTYVRPHRHRTPPKAESFLLLTGALTVFLFDEGGRIVAHHHLAPTGLRGIDIAPGLWHSLVVRSEAAVVFEVKPGPYRVADDKEFAPWAPPEGSPAVGTFMADLLAAAPMP